MPLPLWSRFKIQSWMLFENLQGRKSCKVLISSVPAARNSEEQPAKEPVLKKHTQGRDSRCARALWYNGARSALTPGAERGGEGVSCGVTGPKVLAQNSTLQLLSSPWLDIYHCSSATKPFQQFLSLQLSTALLKSQMLWVWSAVEL